MIEKSLRNYLVTALLVAGVLFGSRTLWTETVKVGCLPVDGKAPAEAWMDGCASDQIGSYDRDVLWFNLVPEATAGIDRAKALIFGDSRILTAMSEGIGPSWFASRNIPMYLLAFGANEQSGWAERLLQKFHMQPDLVVFDADPYFTGQLAVPSSVLFADPVAEEKSARATKAFLDAAPTWCGFLPWLCGRTERSYRTFRDGSIIHQDQQRVWFNHNEQGAFPIPVPGPQDTSHYDDYLANARALIGKLHVRPECVVLTVTPNSEMDDTFAKFLAARLGATVVAPRPDGLATSDHFHLNVESAQAWTKAFFQELEPVAKRCVRTVASAGLPADGRELARAGGNR